MRSNPHSNRRTGSAICVLSLAAALLGLQPLSVAADTFDIANGDVNGLNAAIIAANDTPGSHTINLAPGGVYTILVPDHVGTGLPTVTGTLTIVGNGAIVQRALSYETPPFNALELAASFRFRILESSGDLTLDGITLRYGNTLDDPIFPKLPNHQGGAILNTGTLTLINSTVAFNIVGSPGLHCVVFFEDCLGGAIYNTGTLNLIDSTVADSAASIGGGIFSTGTVSLVNSTVAGNQAFATGGGIASLMGTMSVVNSTVTGNSAAFGSGGGIANAEGPLTVTDSVISNNSVLVPNSGSPGGGGIASIVYGDFPVVITNSRITGNSVSSSSDEFGSGGGIHHFGGTMTVTGSTISNNTSRDLGGGIYSDTPPATLTIDGCTVSNNAAFAGGGVAVSDIALVLTNSTISDNTARLTGGGITILSPSSTTVSDLRIVDNVASTDHVGIGGEDYHDFGGGGMAIALAMDATFTRLTIQGNSADLGGGLSVVNSSEAGLTLLDSTVSGNTAGIGGGIFQAGELILTNTTVSGNTATAVIHGPFPGGGGGIYNAGSILTLSNSTIATNSSVAAGGGIFGIPYDGPPYDDEELHNPSTTLKNTVVAGNLVVSSNEECGGANVPPFITSLGYNLDTDNSCGLIAATDLGGTVAPLLGPLADNGGSTQTHAPLPGSPLIDAIPAADCTDAGDTPLLTDQRGAARPVGTNCDIGAVEWTASGCGTTCPARLIHWVAYSAKAPKADAMGLLIPDKNQLPKPWAIAVNDIHIPDSDADDPENFTVGSSRDLLLPANKNAEGGPNDPALHYIGYQMKSGKQGVGPQANGMFPKPAKHIPRLWQLDNAFGAIQVESKKVTRLLLPAGMDATSSPAGPADATHFVCYGVEPSGGSEQAPGGKLRKDLQGYFADEFGDCALLADGATTSFAGTDVEGNCLFDLRKSVELCNPIDITEVVPPRQTEATPISEATAETTKSLLCYKATLAKGLASGEVAALGGGSSGDKLDPKQAKPVRRTVKTENPLYVTPGSDFPYPVLLDSHKSKVICVPTDVLSVSAAP